MLFELLKAEESKGIHEDVKEQDVAQAFLKVFTPMKPADQLKVINFLNGMKIDGLVKIDGEEVEIGLKLICGDVEGQVLSFISSLNVNK